MADLFTPDALVSLLTLTILEIVLGIDNVVFISILADKVPDSQKPIARKGGLLLALSARIGLLFGVKWLMTLEDDLFTLFEMGFSAKDLILIGGGAFLIAKSTSEIHEKLEEAEMPSSGKSGETSSLLSVLAQIVAIDVVFSFDSILTAVGLAKQVIIMVIAMVLAIVVMLIFAKQISDFVNKHPSVKMLALSFLIMIGFLLAIEAFEFEVPKGYIYFAMGFSLLVEMLNMQFRKRRRKALGKSTDRDHD